MSTRFDYFWTLVPQKRGKMQARKKYNEAIRKLVNRDPDTDPHEYICEAIQRYCRSQRVADGIILLPSSWLHQERYDDEDIGYADDDPETKKERVTLMDDSTRSEMERARRKRAERTQSNGQICTTCGADMFFGKVTNQWQCTTRECYDAQKEASRRVPPLHEQPAGRLI